MELQIAVLSQEFLSIFFLLNLIEIIYVICHVLQHDHIVQTDDEWIVLNVFIEDESCYLSLNFLRESV